MTRQLIDAAILVAFVLGSAGFIGNNVLESRRGVGHPVLRWLRNGALLVVWPLLILRAVV